MSRPTNQLLKASLLMSCLTAGMAACDAAATSSSDPFRVDTTATGRVVVENSGEGAWSAGAAWRLEEVLRLGSIGGGTPSPEEFGDVASIGLDSTGRIYVLDSQAQEIRVFEPSGAFSHTIGRPGSGPGEFEFARAMVITPGDTVIVRDDATMRYSIFAPDGTFLGSHRRDIRGTNPAVAPTWVLGGYLDWAPDFPDGRFGSRFHLLPIHYAADFTAADTFPPIEHSWDILPSGRLMTYHASRPVGAASSSGTLWVAESSRYELHRRSLSGDTTLTVTMAVSPAQVSDVELEALREDLGDNPDFLAQVLAALPASLPVVPVLFTDSAGHLFALSHTSAHALGSVLDVFSEKGVFLGRMSVPKGGVTSVSDGQRIRASPEHILMLSRDELDVPYVVLYRIVKPS